MGQELDNPTMQETMPTEERLPDAEGEGIDWGNVDNDLTEYDDEPVAAETVEGDVEVLAAPAEETPAPEVKAEPVVATPAAVEPPAVAVQAPPPITPEAAAALEAMQVQKLTEMYKLSEEEAQAIITEPENVLPKLLARMHLQATKSVMESMNAAVPQIMQTSQKQAQAEAEARNAFFTVNDDLNKPEYEEAIMQMGKTFRSVNKSASKEDAIVKIGELTRAALGLPPKTHTAPPPVADVPVTKPFTPARGGARTEAKQASNVWSMLATEEDDDF